MLNLPSLELWSHGIFDVNYITVYEIINYLWTKVKSQGMVKYWALFLFNNQKYFILTLFFLF